MPDVYSLLCIIVCFCICTRENWTLNSRLLYLNSIHCVFGDLLWTLNACPKIRCAENITTTSTFDGNYSINTIAICGRMQQQQHHQLATQQVEKAEQNWNRKTPKQSIRYATSSSLAKRVRYICTNALDYRVYSLSQPHRRGWIYCRFASFIPFFLHFWSHLPLDSNMKCAFVHSMHSRLYYIHTYCSAAAMASTRKNGARTSAGNSFGFVFPYLVDTRR